MKNIKKKIRVAITLAVIGITGFIAYVENRSAYVVPVLMYHSLHKDDGNTSLYTSPGVFEEQMGFLARNNYNVIGPDDIVAIMKKEKRMPSKTVAITVDDGFYNFYKYAFPTLKKYNLKATVFIITDKIGKPGRLGWKELREMSDSGLISVECHTKSHPWLPQISVDEKKLYEEIVLSKNILEKGLNKKVGYICYPNGGFNDLVKETARNAGYKGAFTTNPTRYSDIGDIYAIRRLKMSSSSVSPLIMGGKLTKYYAWYKEKR